MKRILIPTDLSVRSLQPVHDALASFPGKQVRITLLHMLSVPEGIGDLLRLSRRNKASELISEVFADACAVLRNKYESQLPELRTEFLYGDTAAVLNNYIEGTGFDAVFLLDNHPYRSEHRESTDMRPFFNKISIPVQTCSVRSAGTVNATRQTLSDLMPALS